MHDRNGTPLKVGDKVTVEMVITSVSPEPGYCNVSAKSVLGRKPDGLNEHFCGNAAVLLLTERTP